MTIQDLRQYKDQHGRITYRDKYDRINIWFGYIREVAQSYVVVQDNETPHKFKVAKVIGFTPMKLPSWKQTS
jgi:hypothetical protein